MPSVTIRDVPEDVHRILAERARLEGRSLQEHLLHQLQRYAAVPTVAEVVEQSRRRVRESGRRVPREAIVAAVRDGRDER